MIFNKPTDCYYKAEYPTFAVLSVFLAILRHSVIKFTRQKFSQQPNAYDRTGSSENFRVFESWTRERSEAKFSCPTACLREINSIKIRNT
ncbi:MAG: hypothetical protein R2822_30855 [Spirosomataceae bacterium]